MSLPTLAKLAWIGALVAVVSIFAPVIAHAAPNTGGDSFGCSMKDIQSPQAAQCIRQAEQDIMSGSATTHVLRCEAGKMHCCETAGEGIDITTCRYVGPLAISRNPNNTILDGLTVMSSEEPPTLSIGTPSR